MVSRIVAIPTLYSCGLVHVNGARLFGKRPGNVGIGTTSPKQKLEVAGVIRATGLTSAGAGTDVNVDASGDLYKVSSSIRYKKDIEDMDIDAEKVLSFRPVSFKWKETDTPDMGLIAEEVAETIPHLVTRDLDGNPESVKYSQLSVYLLDLVKKLSEENKYQQELIQT